MLLLQFKVWFTILIIISLFTAAVDGFLARRLKQETKRGARLDSAGDFITQLLMVAGLFRFQQVFLEAQKITLLVILGLFILQTALALLKYRQTTSFHTYSAKAAFVSLSIFYVVLFLFKYVEWLFLSCAVLMIFSLVEDIILVVFYPGLIHPQKVYTGF
jgi:phosphatidylglycerophosphate synthase